MEFRPADRLKGVRKSAIRGIMDAARPGSINLGIGEPDFQTPEVVRREACRVINNERNGYSQNVGLIGLRERIAAYHSDNNGREYTSSSVCVTSGVEEALFVTTMTIAGPGDEVLLPDPGFLAYPNIVEIAGANPVYYRLPATSRFGFDRDSFDAAWSPKTRLMFLTSPSNPTGRVLAPEDLAHIASRLAESGAWVIADEIYRELYFDEKPRSIAEYYPNTVVLSGLSKMMSMTGWRIGWAAGPRDVIEQITLMHQYATSCASTISQKAGIEAFTEEGRRATAEMRVELASRGRVMASALDALGLPYVLGEGAFYVMLDVSSFGEAEEVAYRLLDELVITVPGGAFGSESKSYLRLSFPIAPALILEGIRRIGQGLAKL